MCDEMYKVITEHDHCTNDYLIVSRTKKDVTYVYRQFREYLLKLKDACVHVQNRYQTVIIDSEGFHSKIRFVSEREYIKASIGFRGWALSGYDLEQWLDAAEEYEREEA